MFNENEKKRITEIDMLNHLLGKYISFAFHEPKNYPNKSFLDTSDEINNVMTDEEMENPKIIEHSRIQRISRGAGVSESDVKDLLKYYNNTKKAMKGISRRGMGGGAMNRLMGQFMNR